MLLLYLAYAFNVCSECMDMDFVVSLCAEGKRARQCCCSLCQDKVSSGQVNNQDESKGCLLAAERIQQRRVPERKYSDCCG